MTLIVNSRCQCGEICGEPCDNTADILIEWMPKDLRDSHEAAGNSGSYPHNGSVRLRVSSACVTGIDGFSIVRTLTVRGGRRAQSH